MAKVIVEAEKFVTRPISVIGYLKKCKNQEIKMGISTNREVGMGNWKQEDIDSFIRTLICGYHVPAVYVCELDTDDEWKQSLIVDGQHRTFFMFAFRFENYKISKKFNDPIIKYYSIVKDENGKTVYNDDEVAIEEKEFDLRDKTFADLPEELKENFDNTEFSIITAENCSMEKMAEYVIRYNNHTSFNKMQSSFAKLFNIAKTMRKVSHHCFFKEILTPAKFVKGNADKITMDALLITKFGIDSWIKDPVALANYLNDNTTNDDVNELYELIDRMYEAIGDELDSNKEFKKFFCPKDAALLIKLYQEFEKYSDDGDLFVNSINKMIESPSSGLVELSKNRNTRNKNVIVAKYNALKDFIFDSIGVNENNIDSLLDECDYEIGDDTTEKIDVTDENKTLDDDFCNKFLDLSIVKEQNIKNVSDVIDRTKKLFEKNGNEKSLDDILYYTELLNDISESTELDCPVYCEENLPSLIYMMDVIYNSDLSELIAEKWYVNYIHKFEEEDNGSGYEECLALMMSSFEMFKKFQTKTK